MFKNRSLKVTMVKDAEEVPATKNLLDSIDFCTLDKKVKEYTKKAVVGGVLTYAAVVAINTVSTVIVNNTDPARRK